MQIEFYQHDWVPGFAGFLDVGGKLEKHPDSKAFCILNLGAFLATVAAGDDKPENLPYSIAESLMHEIMHALEKWAGVEFSEERVEALIHKYRVSIGKEAPDAVFSMPEDPVEEVATRAWKLLSERDSGRCKRVRVNEKELRRAVRAAMEAQT